MEENKSDGACTPSVSSARLEMINRLREIADIADAGEKPHWASEIRAAVEELSRLGRIEVTAAQMLAAIEALPGGTHMALTNPTVDLADALAGASAVPWKLRDELIWCRDEGNTGPRTHALLVALCDKFIPNAEITGSPKASPG